MHVIRTEISLGVVTALRNEKIVASTAILGDAHEAINTDTQHACRSVYERAVEIVMRHLGRKRMTPKLERMIVSGVVKDGDKLILLMWPEPDQES